MLLGFCFSGVLALSFSKASLGEAGRVGSVSYRQQISVTGFVLTLATIARGMAQRAGLFARAGRRAVLVILPQLPAYLKNLFILLLSLRWRELSLSRALLYCDYRVWWQ